MKRIFTSVPVVSLFILGLGFLGNLGLGDAGIVPTAQAAAACSLATLRGGYGYTATAITPGVGENDAVGVFTFNGAGNLTGADTISTQSGVIGERTITGIYTVNADCTGSMSLEVPGYGHSEWDIVIVETGKTIRAIQTSNPGIVSTWVANKM